MMLSKAPEMALGIKGNSCAVEHLTDSIDTIRIPKQDKNTVSEENIPQTQQMLTTRRDIRP